MSTPIHTSLVMAVRNRSALLKGTLKGYCRYAPHPGVELVVADYGSTDNLGRVLKDARGVFQRIRHLVLDVSKSVVPINPAFNNPAVALNVAIRYSVAPLVIMSPPECYPLADNMRKAHSILDGGKRDIALFGKAIKMAGGKWANAIKEGTWLPPDEKEVYKRMPEKKQLHIRVSEKFRRAVPFLMAYPRKAHDAVNGFDEEHVRGYAGEDSDYVSRLKAAGMKHLWDDTCSVLHQWHKFITPGDYGTRRGWSNWYRDGLRANPHHEPGSPKMVVQEHVIR